MPRHGLQRDAPENDLNMPIFGNLKIFEFVDVNEVEGRLQAVIGEQSKTWDIVVQNPSAVAIGALVAP